MTDKKDKDLVLSTTQELLKKLQIEAVVEIQKEEDVYKINIQTEEQGLLIGYHGNTLNSFQLILGILLFKKTSQWYKVIINVGDYRQKREEALRRMAVQSIQRAIENKEEIVLPFLTAFERRIIHLVSQDYPEVVTQSQGEGKDRRLTIKLKDTTA